METQTTVASRHFSMIRDFHLADFFTLANGGCGIAAIFLALDFAARGSRNNIYIAAALIIFALVFDVVDGRVARARHQSSALGRELDSLADVISFGVAPAAITYAAGVNTWIDSIVLIFFALCGLSRLARYNVTTEALDTVQHKVTHFEGTPIPTSVVPLAILVAALGWNNFLLVTVAGFPYHLSVLPFAVSGCLMVSKTLRIPKL